MVAVYVNILKANLLDCIHYKIFFLIGTFNAQIFFKIVQKASPIKK